MLRTATATAALAVLALAVPAGASAATKNGITPSTPKGAVPAGKAVTFKGRFSGPGVIFVHVCKSAKRSKKEGTICTTESIGQAKKSGSRFSFTQKPFAFDEYWLNQPGTYYWQAHRISCEGTSTSDCRQEGPVVKFRVR